MRFRMRLSAPSRALLAGILWLFVGLFLILRGCFPYWIEIARESFTGGVVLLLVAALVGAAKGWFLLRRSSMRMLAYIDARHELVGFWHVYPPRFYLVIPLMVGLGLALRAGFGTSLPALVAGVYLAVGAALLASTPPFFRYWRTDGVEFHAALMAEKSP